MVAFGATFCSPAAGLLDARSKEDEAAFGPAAPVRELLELESAVGEP
jgi:hypothetical protein